MSEEIANETEVAALSSWSTTEISPSWLKVLIVVVKASLVSKTKNQFKLHSNKFRIQNLPIASGLTAFDTSAIVTEYKEQQLSSGPYNLVTVKYSTPYPLAFANLISNSLVEYSWQSDGQILISKEDSCLSDSGT